MIINVYDFPPYLQFTGLCLLNGVHDGLSFLHGQNFEDRQAISLTKIFATKRNEGRGQNDGRRQQTNVTFSDK